MRDIGNGEQELLQGFVKFGDSLVVALDLLGNFFHAGQDGAGVLAGFFQARDFVAGLVAVGLEALVLSDELAALGVERFEIVEIDFGAAVARHFLDHLEVIAYVGEI